MHGGGLMRTSQTPDDRPSAQGSGIVDLAPAVAATARPRVVIVSNVRLYREGVAISLSRNPVIDVIATTSASDAIMRMPELCPDVALLDASLVDGQSMLRHMRDSVPQLRIVAFAVSDSDNDVIACAEAGISAYVSCEASADDLIDAVHQAMRGEFVCTPRVTALLLTHVAALSAERLPFSSLNGLTQREKEIIPLIELGLSNKEIARRLHVEAATVKNHVHNILEKLQVRRRGEVAVRVRRR